MAIALKVVVCLFLVTVVYQEKTIAVADRGGIVLSGGGLWHSLLEVFSGLPWDPSGQKPANKHDEKPPAGKDTETEQKEVANAAKEKEVVDNAGHEKVASKGGAHDSEIELVEPK